MILRLSLLSQRVSLTQSHESFVEFFQCLAKSDKQKEFL